MPVKDIASFESDALTLPATQRAILAKHLLASLDDLEEREIEQMWLDEAERRYQLHKDGSLSSRDAFKAIAEARKRL
ncbi:addiction module protein [Geobacter argillaceus]|uniref:Putative addiction module component n=1 Tax=Geobacter argillaceus TaxID=345631 RepID=A0A562WRU9_9BACT|nr:addiction module protein [Geobacter argillaceus]TWJ33037.1 putative addiction module component [Geobacter argillaceus]